MDVTYTRRGAWWGIAFALLLAAGLAVLISIGEPGPTEQELVAWYEREGGSFQLFGVVVGTAGFCLLGYLGSLRQYLRRAEGDAGGLSSLAFGAGLVLTAMLFAMAAAVATVGTAADWNGADDPFRVEPSVSEPLWILGWWFGVFGAVSGGMLAGATSVLAWRIGVFARWHAIVGLIVAAAGVATYATWGLSLLAVVGWVLLTSVVMLVTPRQREGVAAAARA